MVEAAQFYRLVFYFERIVILCTGNRQVRESDIYHAVSDFLLNKPEHTLVFEDVLLRSIGRRKSRV